MADLTPRSSLEECRQEALRILRAWAESRGAPGWYSPRHLGLFRAPQALASLHAKGLVRRRRRAHTVKEYEYQLVQ